MKHFKHAPLAFTLALGLFLTGCNVHDNNVDLSVAPQITLQPNSITVNEGSNANFTVNASGADVSFQWIEETPAGDIEIPGATSATLTITSVTTTTHNGKKYKCRAKNPKGTVTTQTVTLTVTLSAPAIATQPSSVTVAAGSNATFTVVATGSDLTYRWVDGVSDTIAGAVTATLTITAVTTAHNGKQYKCVVRNGGGTVTTTTVTLTVTGTALFKPREYPTVLKA
jgi:hypothetical protein